MFQAPLRMRVLVLGRVGRRGGVPGGEGDGKYGGVVPFGREVGRDSRRRKPGIESLRIRDSKVLSIGENDSAYEYLCNEQEGGLTKSSRK